MASSVMLCRVALVRTDVSEELSASIIRVTRICELGTTVLPTHAAKKYKVRKPCHFVLLRSVRRLLGRTVVPSSPGWLLTHRSRVSIPGATRFSE
jgi:hypothetical protein